MTIDQLLADARSRLQRLSPEESQDAACAGEAVIVDIREEGQRERNGRVPGAIEISRLVLEWRCDPASEWRDERISNPDRTLVVMCNEGYQSSLAAAVLQDLGLPKATDMIDGFEGWRAAGLPISKDGTGFRL